MDEGQFAQLLSAVNRLADSVAILAHAACDQAAAADATLEVQGKKPAPRIVAVAPHKQRA